MSSQSAIFIVSCVAAVATYLIGYYHGARRRDSKTDSYRAEVERAQAEWGEETYGTPLRDRIVSEMRALGLKQGDAK